MTARRILIALLVGTILALACGAIFPDLETAAYDSDDDACTSVTCVTATAH